MECRAKTQTHICLTPDFRLLTQHCFEFLSMSMRQPMPEVEFPSVGEVRGGICGDELVDHSLLW